MLHYIYTVDNFKSFVVNMLQIKKIPVVSQTTSVHDQFGVGVEYTPSTPAITKSPLRKASSLKERHARQANKGKIKSSSSPAILQKKVMFSQKEEKDTQDVTPASEVKEPDKVVEDQANMKSEGTRKGGETASAKRRSFKNKLRPSPNIQETLRIEQVPSRSPSPSSRLLAFRERLSSSTKIKDVSKMQPTAEKGTRISAFRRRLSPLRKSQSEDLGDLRRDTDAQPKRSFFSRDRLPLPRQRSLSPEVEDIHKKRSLSFREMLLPSSRSQEDHDPDSPKQRSLSMRERLRRRTTVEISDKEKKKSLSLRERFGYKGNKEKTLKERKQKGLDNEIEECKQSVDSGDKLVPSETPVTGDKVCDNENPRNKNRGCDKNMILDADLIPAHHGETATDIHTSSELYKVPTDKQESNSIQSKEKSEHWTQDGGIKDGDIVCVSEIIPVERITGDTHMMKSVLSDEQEDNGVTDDEQNKDRTEVKGNNGKISLLAEICIKEKKSALIDQESQEKVVDSGNIFEKIPVNTSIIPQGDTAVISKMSEQNTSEIIIERLENSSILANVPLQIDSSTTGNLSIENGSVKKENGSDMQQMLAETKHLSSDENSKANHPCAEILCEQSTKEILKATPQDNIDIGHVEQNKSDQGSGNHSQNLTETKFESQQSDDSYSTSQCMDNFHFDFQQTNLSTHDVQHTDKWNHDSHQIEKSNHDLKQIEKSNHDLKQIDRSIHDSQQIEKSSHDTQQIEKSSPDTQQFEKSSHDFQYVEKSCHDSQSIDKVNLDLPEQSSHLQYKKKPRSFRERFSSRVKDKSTAKELEKQKSEKEKGKDSSGRDKEVDENLKLPSSPKKKLSFRERLPSKVQNPSKLLDAALLKATESPKSPIRKALNLKEKFTGPRLQVSAKLLDPSTSSDSPKTPKKKTLSFREKLSPFKSSKEKDKDKEKDCDKEKEDKSIKNVEKCLSGEDLETETNKVLQVEMKQDFLRISMQKQESLKDLEHFPAPSSPRVLEALTSNFECDSRRTSLARSESLVERSPLVKQDSTTSVGSTKSRQDSIKRKTSIKRQLSEDIGKRLAFHCEHGGSPKKSSVDGGGGSGNSTPTPGVVAPTLNNNKPDFLQEEKPLVQGVTTRAASITKLVLLAIHCFDQCGKVMHDSEFPRVLFLMHEWFITSEELAEKLLEIYNNSQDYVTSGCPAECTHRITTSSCAVHQFRTKVCHCIRYWIAAFPIHFDLSPRLSHLVHNFQDSLPDEDQHKELVDVSKVPSYDWMRNMSVKDRNMRHSSKVSLSFGNLQPAQLAEQLTFLEYKAFRRITFRDLKNYAINATLKNNPKLERSIALFNGLSQWVQCMVLSKTTPLQRSDVMAKFVNVSKRLKQLQNYNTLMAVVGGLTHSALARLNKTNSCIGPDVQKTLMEYTELLSSSNNFSNYRRELLHAKGFRIPILGVHLKDLVCLHTALPDKIDGLVNYRKVAQLSIIFTELMQVQNSSLPIEPNMDLVNTIKLSLDLHYTEDEIYELSLAREPRNSLSSPSTPTKPVMFADWVAGISPPDAGIINKHVNDMVEAVFKNYDHDKDGFISHAEFEEIAGNFPFIDSFCVLDADKDGMISKTEMKTYFIRANCHALRNSFKHAFHETTYFKPTFCIHCTGLLWGIIKQGWKCKECSINAHKHCKDLVVMECRPKTHMVVHGRASSIQNGAGNQNVTMASKRKMSQRQRRSHITRSTQTEASGMADDTNSPKMSIREESIEIPTSASQVDTSTPTSASHTTSIDSTDTEDSRTDDVKVKYKREEIMREDSRNTAEEIMEELDILEEEDEGVQAEVLIRAPLAEAEFYEDPAILYERLVAAEEARDKVSSENENLRSKLETQNEQIQLLKSHIGVIRQNTITFILDQMDTLHMQRDTEV